MLTIRKEQMAALDAYMLQSFRERMVERIAVKFPAQFKQLGEPGTHKLIGHGMETGAARGIRAERDVGVLIELMAQFGANFEQAPEPPWARQILLHPTLSGQAKVQLLQERLTAKPAKP